MMRVNVDQLKQQTWRASLLFEQMERYARSIGCTTEFKDEIICHTDEQAQKLAAWWREKTA